MFDYLADMATSFSLGLLTPLTAACVLPLYPGFLAYLSNKLSSNAGWRTMMLVGLVVNAGILSFMFLVGLVFTTVLQVSLTSVIGIVSPIAFIVMLFISVLLLIDLDFSRYLPHYTAPVSSNPWKSAFVFGFFFGAIVIPCNPGFIAVFFTRTLLVRSVLPSMLNFTSFGLGLGFPLLVISALTAATGARLISFFVGRKTLINRISGFIMMMISVYYLLTVFNVLGLG
ncbi:MAG: cytochrome c biogenesis protein CcdA [Candidatus Altiarchaeota archaeon]